jgi:hypothetical protein
MRAADEADSWRRIRALRARPPGLAAADSERRSVFNAALTQSEELFDASRTIGAASRPLPLFYGLSQAGRALAAAYNQTDNWRVKGHGISIHADDGGDLRAATITVVPRKDASDAYTAAAIALESDRVTGSTTVASVWAAIPELLQEPHMRGAALPALEIRPDAPSGSLFSGVVEPAHGSIIVADAPTEQLVSELLDRYARTCGHRVLIGPMPTVGAMTSAVIDWPTEPRPEATPGTKAFRAMPDVAIFVEGSWYLQPPIGEPPSAAKPILVWWLLLIALSSLARYHPQTWTAALELNEARSAVELRSCLDIAQRRIPELLASALEPPPDFRAVRASHGI